MFIYVFLQVQRSLDNRLHNIAQFDNIPSAPDDVDGNDDEGGHVYPSLHSLQNLPTMPRWDDTLVTAVTFRHINCLTNKHKTSGQFYKTLAP